MPDTEPILNAVLELVEHDGSRRQVRVNETPFLIGRGEEAGNHLQLADKRISRRCAAVIFKDDGFYVEDRGHRHGVFVNNEQVESRALREGDIITFGIADAAQLVFHAGEPQESLPQLLSRLEQASALEPGTRDLRQLSLLLEATALLQSHLPLEYVLGAMVDRALTITDADRGLLYETEPSGGLRALVGRQKGGRTLETKTVVASQTALAQALGQRHSFVVEDTTQAPSPLREATSVVNQQLRSVIAIPLLAVTQLRATDQTFIPTPGEVRGVLYLDSRRPATFSRLERRILDALALEAASVLENARQVQKELERQRMEQELTIARDIQQALLPRRLQTFKHCQVSATNHPCLAVGGDYFDLMELGPDRTAFTIADVSGKGLGAALVMAMLQGNLSAMALGHEPAALCAHINKFICNRPEMERYATLFFGLLGADGKLELINAGHLPPLLVRGGRAEFQFGAQCLPLGLVPAAEFKSTTAELQPGDTLVLYTDGITEAVNPREEQFGLERLQELVRKNASAPVEELQAAILQEVENFTRGAYQADDITLMIVRYTGAS